MQLVVMPTQSHVSRETLDEIAALPWHSLCVSGWIVDSEGNKSEYIVAHVGSYQDAIWLLARAHENVMQEHSDQFE